MSRYKFLHNIAMAYLAEEKQNGKSTNTEEIDSRRERSEDTSRNSEPQRGAEEERTF